MYVYYTKEKEIENNFMSNTLLRYILLKCDLLINFLSLLIIGYEKWAFNLG